MPSSPLASPIETRPLTPVLWPDLEALFGPKGACGGCWCMHWRLARGEKWDDLKGAPAKARFRDLVRSGEALGVLAYADGEPVGWANFGPKSDFDRLARSPTLGTPDARDVWAIPCFYIKPGWRGRGVASALLEAAVAAIRDRGGRIVEGYPVQARGGERLSGAFAWTGTLPLFDKRGFRVAEAREKGKVRVRRTLRMGESGR